MASTNEAPSRPVKTAVAAQILGVSYHQTIGLIRYAKLTPLPERDSSGDYWWTADDLERARQALATDRRLKAHRTPKGKGKVPA